MAIIAHGAHAAEKTHSHLRSDRQKNDTSAPSLDNVIESLAKYLWSDRAPTPFLVKGSFPASVWIKEHSQLDLPYNDIDVVIDTPTPEDDCEHDASSKVKSQFGPSQFVDSVYVDGVIPGSDKTVQVVTLCDIHNHYDELIVSRIRKVLLMLFFVCYDMHNLILFAFAPLVYRPNTQTSML